MNLNFYNNSNYININLKYNKMMRKIFYEFLIELYYCYKKKRIKFSNLYLFMKKLF